MCLIRLTTSQAKSNWERSPFFEALNFTMLVKEKKNWTNDAKLVP
jgi:hypothetical protein